MELGHRVRAGCLRIDLDGHGALHFAPVEFLALHPAADGVLRVLRGIAVVMSVRSFAPPALRQRLAPLLRPRPQTASRLETSFAAAVTCG